MVPPMCTCYPPAALTGLCCCVLRPGSLGSYLGPVRVMGSLRVHVTCATCVHLCVRVSVLCVYVRVHVTCATCVHECPSVRVMGSLRVACVHGIAGMGVQVEMPGTSGVQVEMPATGGYECTWDRR